MSASDWAAILGNDERVVWQGRPSGGVWQGLTTQRRRIKGGGLIFLIALGAFSFTLLGDTQISLVRLLFGGVLLGFAFLWLSADILWHMTRHATSFYTLTNTHAYIGAYPFGFRILEHYKLTPEMNLRHDENLFRGQSTHSLILKQGVRDGELYPLRDKGFMFVASNSGLQEAFEALFRSECD
ncbi:hypothetical protein [Aliiroseovarius crassostreae]|uniref:hypothetical protein n=1 Tax=Aliiroseovarius crassostreae TaxID=154981 RepID=UPI003C7C73E8